MSKPKVSAKRNVFQDRKTGLCQLRCHFAGFMAKNFGSAEASEMWRILSLKKRSSNERLVSEKKMAALGKQAVRMSQKNRKIRHVLDCPAADDEIKLSI